ncbi:DUF6462 family protein [Butyrivibrio sp. INlla16]|uniref:DUF6462 family protein n=1 Tax=Butyrivibrio sp. INlla16 TaxID=1520807 RepID=UPI000885A8C4|nr:DUF6462 family protein [Butyrivibrio sp. INlla16]SDB51596.1 hypothetical protein SAMN02910263_02591 [Butyrivibrio sp. INlla16]
MKREIDQKKFVRLADGPEIYDVSYNTFVKMAKAAHAIHKWGSGVTLINTADLDRYLEHYRVDEPLPEEA